MSENRSPLLLPIAATRTGAGSAGSRCDRAEILADGAAQDRAQVLDPALSSR
ncbi:MAG: hypothetical protein JO212_01210 [Acetobacteraceae bacterium]|nr:hypothetical protein [Acetobacteraceae bacterium]